MQQTLPANQTAARLTHGGRAQNLPLRQRLLLLLCAAVATGGAALAALTLAPAPSGAPDLVRLLRFMGALKGAIVLGAASLVWWRLARPVASSLLVSYVAAVALAGVAAVWLWSQWQMGWGIGLFYASLGALAFAARRDGALIERG